MNEKLKRFLIPKDMSLKEAMQFMSTYGSKEVFVVDGHHRLFGSLSNGDIRRWILAEGRLRASVGRVCNQTPKTVGEHFDPQNVKSLMLQLKIEAVPVVNAKGQVQDVLVWGDIFAGKVVRPKAKLQIPVVIMAGGKGTRLDPFTKILPKPLVPIGDKPVIQCIMDKFHEYDIRHFYVSINHKAAMIKSYFQEAQVPYKVDFLQEEEPLGTAGSLRMLAGNPARKFLVTNCDVIVNSDYAEMVELHDEHQNDLTVVVSCRHYVIPYGVCDISQGGLLKSLKEKPEYDLLVNTGMYVVNRRVLRLIPKKGPLDITGLISRCKDRGLRVGAFPIDEQSWIDVGQWDEYHKAIKLLGV